MKALIVESAPDLATVWKRHLERNDIETCVASGQAEAVAHLQETAFEILILDLVLEEGSAIAIADYANYRQPDARVIFVTNTSFFSDGSIFRHSPNACAFVQSDAPPDDLLAMVEHYGRAAS